MATIRDERSQQTRDLILNAAIELFAENSYRATSFVDIEARSGVSRGSIPWHFGDKEGLLREVVDRLRQEQQERFRQIPPGDADGARIIGNRAALAVQGVWGKALLALLLEAVDPASPIHHSFGELHEAARNYYAEWIKLPAVAAGLPAGVSSENVSTALFGAIIGINQQWNLNPDGVDLAASHETLMRTMFSWLDWEGTSPSREGEGKGASSEGKTTPESAP